MGISGLALEFWFALHAHDDKTNRRTLHSSCLCYMARTFLICDELHRFLYKSIQLMAD